MNKCPTYQILNLIGKKWTMVVIQEVGLSGRKGFNTIFKRMNKISPKLLAKRLGELEESGIVEKKAIKRKNVLRTSYKLTKGGEELQEIINILKKRNIKCFGKGFNCPEKECVSCPIFLHK